MYKSKNDAFGMKGERSRTLSGRLRKKRWDAHLGPIEQTYSRELGEDRSALRDALLRLEKDSLSKIIKSPITQIKKAR